MISRILILCILSMALAACSKSGGKGDGDGEIAPQDGDYVRVGKMYLWAKEVDQADYSDDCVDKNRDNIFFITKKLDSLAKRYYSIVENRMKVAKSSGRLGPILLREIGVYKESSQWKKYEYDLDKIHKTLSKDVITDAELYLAMSDVARILKNERYRRLDYYNMWIGPNSVTIYKDVLAKVDSCIKEESCYKIVLKKSEEYELRKYWWFGNRLDDLNNDELNISDHRSVLARVQKSLRGVARRYSFKPTSSIKRINGETIELSLDVGDFKGSEKEVARRIESAWSSKKIKIKVRWAKQRKDNAIYKLIHEKGANHGAYVNRSERRVAFPDIIRNVTFEHEIGHVLGFSDNYFEIFNDSTCNYESWSRNDDLMSAASKIIIPESYFEELDRQYPLLQ